MTKGSLTKGKGKGKQKGKKTGYLAIEDGAVEDDEEEEGESEKTRLRSGRTFCPNQRGPEIRALLTWQIARQHWSWLTKPKD